MAALDGSALLLPLGLAVDCLAHRHTGLAWFFLALRARRALRFDGLEQGCADREGGETLAALGPAVPTAPVPYVPDPRPFLALLPIFLRALVHIYFKLVAYIRRYFCLRYSRQYIVSWDATPKESCFLMD